MRIALCDDEKTISDFIESCLCEYAGEHGFNFDIDCFSSGEAFLSASMQYDIIFMDIYLGGMTGTDVVAKLSAADRQRVVFMTSSREHAIEAFGLGVAHYLLKPLKKEDVSAGIERCLASLGESPSKDIAVKTVSNGDITIPMDLIVYIEVFNKVSFIHTTESDFQTYTALSSLMDMLDKKFFLRAQRSYVINMCFVDYFAFDRIVMKNGVEIMLSRNNRTELKDKYQRFLFDMARGREA